ncbi:hypothetical protein DUNSADRAFT_8232 [Dunaliella salina]|uniref:Encoded protein n=1 Tax=Dunaliella salina TaxID=3046 RepID=A0ABQ7HA37_DUNSA|nr:hypothetical protein DUNSADRAFT_8232 [Dunaliella salina]|eukprot:KAF5843717.1 hypothetical protein DUNSADRAFT_8232 [Dunaliella salina]
MRTCRLHVYFLKGELPLPVKFVWSISLLFLNQGRRFSLAHRLFLSPSFSFLPMPYFLSSSPKSGQGKQPEGLQRQKPFSPDTLVTFSTTAHPRGHQKDGRAP